MGSESRAPIRLLVVNSNSSPAATRQIEEGVATCASDDLAIDCVTAAAGPEGIDTLLDTALAAVETARVVAAAADDYDAFVVACGLDPGLDACRMATDRPVVGIAQAGMHYAAALGASFSVVGFAETEVATVRRLAAGYGFAGQLASVVPLAPRAGEQVSTAELIAGREAMYPAFLEAATVARDRDLAEAIVLTGSVFSWLGEPLSRDLDMPVVVGLTAGVRLAESVVRLGLRTSRAFTHRRRVKHDRLGGYPELQAVYGRPPAAA